MATYPQLQVKQWGQTQFNLATASRTLKQKFPFLNLTGLAQVKDLSVYISSKTNTSGRVRHNFTVIQADDGIIALTHWKKVNKKANLVLFYPDLPVGDRLGMTLLFLILTRGNSFAKWKISIYIASQAMRRMTDKMTGFNTKECRCGIRELKVPRLSAEEVAAVEWFWVNVLKCPAM